MDSQVQSEITAFVRALEQCDVVQNYRAAKTEAEQDGRYARLVRQIEEQTSTGNVAALSVLQQNLETEPPLREYLQARLELVTLLQQINLQISSGLGVNIAASLQPSSCCG